MKHLLQHFKTLTKHPQNAEELKGLILQLAIQGKLTENWRQENPNVESASNLLKRIKAEKQKLIEDKIIKKARESGEIDVSEKFEIFPLNWEQAKLVDLGFSTKLAGFENSKYVRLKDEGEVPVIMARNIRKNKIKEEKVKYIDLKTSLLLERSALTKPSLLITSIGAGIGDVAIFDKEERWHLAPNTAKVELFNEHNENLNIVYVLYYLLSPIGQKEIFKSVTTTAQPSLATKAIRDVIVGIPPLEEQKAIVAIVDELFKEVEQLEEQTKNSIQLKEDFVTSALQRLTEADNIYEEWQFLQTHFTEFFTEKSTIKQLRETLLQLAVQGKLTSNWRATNYSSLGGGAEGGGGIEPASELLKRIQTEKKALIAQKKVKKEKPLPPIEDHEKPYDLPKGWVWCRFQDLMKDLRYGTSKKCDYNLGNNPVLRIPNISNGRIDFEDIKSTNLSDKELRDLSLLNNDLLLIRSNGSVALVGRSAVVENIDDGYSFAGYLVRVRVFKDYISSRFLHLILESPSIRKSIEGPIRTTSGVKNINSTEISQLVFAIPPLEEQKAIVKKVNSLMALCDSLEEHIENSQTHIEQLMQSCLREVFENSN
ncbi:restriction endonuclease subunit S [Maribacter flavus]|uniref:Type I restriction modification DNA specificity domain-containing protein n=1 Tax=Maribacter flavus TaxID=1658664 RepID=A0A5B2TU83_9FLAO|nr:restriction endonuclease subunit S [Maribacter flavus]KAA2217190.1 hypothetical protein F0361_14605 [Maribacter flavus]